MIAARRPPVNPSIEEGARLDTTDTIAHPEPGYSIVSRRCAAHNGGTIPVVDCRLILRVAARERRVETC
jgi:hypothetical protein